MLDLLLSMKIFTIKLISVDLFQTLVRLDEGRDQIWKQFLEERFTVELAQQYWDRTSEILFHKLTETALDSHHFKNTRTIIEESYAILFKEINLDYSPHLAGSALIEMHKRNTPYADAELFLKTAGSKYPICLSSDCDTEMITDIPNLYPFDKVFISEELKAYKQNPRFFEQVMDHYKLDPENILHIGDAHSDILMPKQLGIVACWLNRENKKWSHQIRPNFEVQSLMDVVDILG
jgi:HAD superfamily hydrolase (TIGR01509 family)